MDDPATRRRADRPSGSRAAPSRRSGPAVTPSRESGPDPAVTVADKIEQIRTAVRRGRGIPISASCLVNRRELLAALEELAALIPEQLTRAEELLRTRDDVVEHGRERAAQLVEAGRAERDRLLAQTAVWQEAHQAAEAMRAEAEQEAAALRREVDDYVDQKLAGFEIALHKTLAAVDRGRETTPGARPVAVGENTELAQLRQRADDYVTVTFSRFEAALRRTLDQVSRGRERLRDRSGLDQFAVRFGDEADDTPLPGA